MEKVCEKTSDDNENPQKKKTELRHYWWLAIFGFYILMVETGVRQVLNVFVPSVQEHLNCSKTEADIAIIVLPTASSLIAGPVVAMVYQMFGARKTILVGASLCFLGFSLASIASSSLYLFYIYALLIGLGCGLMRNSIISVQCEYFTNRRNAVMSFICIGPGIGIFVLPRILMPIINILSWRVAFQFLACLYIAAAVMAFSIHKKPTPSDKHSFSHLAGYQIWFKLEFFFHALASWCASSVCIIYFSSILPLMKSEYIPNPELVYSYHGIASIFGRTVITLFMSFTKVNIGIIMFVNYAVAQTSLFSASFCYNIWEFRIQNFFSGFGVGLFSATLAPFLLAIVGPSQLPSALGYTNLINGLAAFASVSIAGKVTHHYDSSRSAFYVAILFGGLAIAFAFINSAILIVRDRRRRKPSLSQLQNSAELKKLTDISSTEN